MGSLFYQTSLTHKTTTTTAKALGFAGRPAAHAEQLGTLTPPAAISITTLPVRPCLLPLEPPPPLCLACLSAASNLPSDPRPASPQPTTGCNGACGTSRSSAGAWHGSQHLLLGRPLVGIELCSLFPCQSVENVWENAQHFLALEICE